MKKNVTTFFGEIYGTDEEDIVEVLCLINDEPQVLEVRSFSALLFDQPKVNDHYRITLTEQVGLMTVEIVKVEEDLSEKFKPRHDFFKGLENSAFFKEG